MSWTKTRRVAVWFLTNSTWYLLGALGTVVGMAWAFNIFAFMTWILLFCMILIVLAKTVTAKTAKPMPLVSPPVPIWIDITLDLGMTFLIVAYGHWFYGTLLVLQLIGYIAYHSKPTTVAP